MISTWATLVACLTLVSAISNTAPASDIQRVVSHLQSLMPLHTAAVSERFKRQVQNASGTSNDQPPLSPPPPHMRVTYNKCCKKMPKIINMKSVKECFKSLRPVLPPPGNPAGPPPPRGSPSGPIPTGSPSGPPHPSPRGAPPPPGAKGDDEEFGENDEILYADAQNSSSSGQPQHRPGGKAHKRGRPGAHREHMACAMECAFQKENLIKDGAVDQKAFAAYVNKYVQEKNATVWKAAIDTALKNCSVSVPASIKHEQNCTSGSLEMFQCMGRHIFVNCPASNWKAGDEKCDACRAAPQDCWAKRGQHKRLQKLPRNETQGIHA